MAQRLCRGLIQLGRQSALARHSNCLSSKQHVNKLGLCGIISSRFVSQMAESEFIFRQLIEHRSYTYTYLLADPVSREAILIDPVVDTVERDLRVIRDLRLNLVYAVNTHVHADHITGTGDIKRLIPSCRSAIAEVSTAQADIRLTHLEKLKFGKYELEVRSTPGHTDGCVTFVCHDVGMVFTGDAVLIRGCGRTDFQQGNPETLYNSVHQQIFTLPESYFLYPGHDYTGQTVSTVAEEKNNNPRLSQSLADFVKIMGNLKLPYPKQIDRALPANMVCGLHELEQPQNAV